MAGKNPEKLSQMLERFILTLQTRIQLSNREKKLLADVYFFGSKGGFSRFLIKSERALEFLMLAISVILLCYFAIFPGPHYYSSSDIHERLVQATILAAVFAITLPTFIGRISKTEQLLVKIASAFPQISNTFAESLTFIPDVRMLIRRKTVHLVLSAGVLGLFAALIPNPSTYSTFAFLLLIIINILLAGLFYQGLCSWIRLYLAHSTEMVALVERLDDSSSCPV
jgi:hypothetical protein